MPLAPPWKPGQSGNPRGRPKGSPHRLPTMRALVNAVIAENTEGIRAALTTVLTDPETVLHGLELAAGLNRELGPPQLVLGEEATEAAGLTVVMKQYVIAPAVASAAAVSASAAPRAPEIVSLPVRSDRPLETSSPPRDSEDGEAAPEAPPAVPGRTAEAASAGPVRISLRHFADPEPR